MKRVRLYESFIKEAYKFYDLFFNSHIDHNPECDILEGHLDKDSLITYGIYVKGPKVGLEFMEYYSGSNYKPTSDKRSNSKLFMVDKIPAKYKAMWEDLKKIYQDEYAGSGRVSTRNESLVTEGQFSWMTQDTGNQIGSEKENTIAVTMFDDKGNKWLERKYDGYGVFGGKDYYELLAQMNGIEDGDRQDGIDIAFGKKKVSGKVLFPALIEDPKHFNYKKHDFTEQPQDDPNQSWYMEPEEDDDDDYDEYDESKVTEATSYDPDDIFFLWDDYIDNGREGIERGHTGSGSNKHELFTFDTEVDGYDKFEAELKKLLKKSGWKNEYNQDTLKVYESRILDESKVTEGEVNLFDEIGPELEALRSKISGLMKKSTDDKWTSALGKALSTVSTLDRNLSQADSKLGVVLTEGLSSEQKMVETFLKKVAKEFDYSIQDAARFVKETISKMGLDESKINEGATISVPKLSDIDHTRIIKWMSNQFDSNTWDMKKSGKGFEISIDKLSKAEQEDLMAYLKSQDYIKESKVNEGAISDIHIMAQEAKDFKSFVKEFTKTHHDLSKAGEPGQFEAWLKSIYDDAKESMDESVVTEGKHWHVLSGNTWYTGSDFSTNPADAMKYDDIMSATKVAKKVGGMVHVMTDEEMTKAIKKFGKNESVVTEAKDVKSEVIDKLSQFFGVSTGALIKFNFDGKDDVRALTKALNGTDYEGVDNIVRVAVKAAKRDLGVDEAIKPAGLSKAETKKVAETYAKAISKHDGCKCTVNAKSLEEDSFDLDIDGEEYAGGSYMITLDGDVVNAALPEKPVYGKIDSTVDEIIKNLKK